MPDKQKGTNGPSPADFAREAFRRLAARRIPPTPDAYREIYEEIAGAKGLSPAEKILVDFAAQLADFPGEIGRFAPQFSQALETRNWETCSRHLQKLVEKHLSQPGDAAASPPALLRAAAHAHQNENRVDALPARRASIPLVDEADAPFARPFPIPLVDTIDPPTEINPAPLLDPPASIDSGPKHTRMMREMLIRTWTFPIASLLHGAPELIEESNALVESLKLARTEQELAEVEIRLKQLCFKVEFKSGDMAEENELLLRLFKLLLENVGELLEDDSWLSGQIAGVRDLLSGPIDYNGLVSINRNLKEIIYKQGLLKHNLKEAKATLKNMMLTFVDRLEAFAVNTGDYREKIDNYAQQIGAAKDILDLNRILERVMFDTSVAQTEVRRSCDQMIAIRQDVRAAESRVHELETELRQMSDKVYEDHLTGSLNRRGLDDALERAFSRAERRNLPLCVALLDVDDFKRLNDVHGHSAGDGVLVHLVQVVKDALRAMDIIGRLGGEEFLVVLPDTSLEDAAQTVTRLQRELTKRIFMHNNERILVTFSAGIALRKPDEDQETLIGRADMAMYQAKQAGKNRVVTVE